MPFYSHTHLLFLTWILNTFAHINMRIITCIFWIHLVSDLVSHGFYNTFTYLRFHIFLYTRFLFSHVYTLRIHIHISLTHLHMVTYTLHITLYTYFSAVTHSPNHQRRTHSHHITHRHHLGNAMVTLGLRRPGEQVSTLTSGTCPPPGFHPNALRIS